MKLKKNNKTKKKKYEIVYPIVGEATFCVYANSKEEALKCDMPDEVDHEWECNDRFYPVHVSEVKDDE